MEVALAHGSFHIHFTPSNFLFFYSPAFHQVYTSLRLDVPVITLLQKWHPQRYPILICKNSTRSPSNFHVKRDERLSKVPLVASPLPPALTKRKNTADLVTETDQAVEALVKQSISEKYPDHSFIGEESWAAGEENVITTQGVTWIVDPIDGTTNFVHGFPYTCISIGVVVGGEAVIGVVYAPFMDTLYHGLKGSGSFMSSPHHPAPRRLPLVEKPAPLPDLNQALVAFEWGSDRRSTILDQKLNSFRKITGDPSAGVEGGSSHREYEVSVVQR